MDFAELSFVKPPAKKLRDSSDPLLRSVKQVEKRTFPTGEFFNFDSELAKRTTHFYCALRESAGGSKGSELYGYIVFVRSKLVTRIHKVCVVEGQRGKGVGKWMMGLVLAELRKGGAEKVDLWVDTDREAARRLYLSCGFEEKETVNDYYSAGRHGIRMEVTLAN
ncbi:acyl-CoA N-acyltransferase [Choiromyces venosus 120613-1]|uniref:Acyl-CoA N-acyltransferase n=1 Tax=Choiromyces venosus 120613-1 TaxID=1336337 RepID=A0A3N4JBD2_9PEZI|nr:acyl-CoA N-acyltransferase [Choiromyces venosus 120613-1]